MPSSCNRCSSLASSASRWAMPGLVLSSCCDKRPMHSNHDCWRQPPPQPVELDRGRLDFQRTRVSHVWDRRVPGQDRGGKSASSGRIMLDHARGTGLPRARWRRRGHDPIGSPRPTPAPTVPGSIRIRRSRTSPRSIGWRHWAGSSRCPIGSRREQKPELAALRFAPGAGVTPAIVEAGLGARRGGLEVLSLGPQARPGQAGRLAVAARGGICRCRAGPARWPSATRDCPPKAGST